MSVGIWKAGSSAGFSVFAVYIESLMFSMTILYYYQNKYPLSTYGNYFILYVSNIGLLFIVYYVTNTLDIYTKAVLIIKSILFIIFFTNIIPIRLIIFMFKFQVFLILLCRLPQIFAIWNNSGPGATAFLTKLFMQTGFMCEAFTVFTELTDPYPQLMCLLNCCLNGTTLLQFGYYGIKLKMINSICPSIMKNIITGNNTKKTSINTKTLSFNSKQKSSK